MDARKILSKSVTICTVFVFIMICYTGLSYATDEQENNIDFGDVAVGSSATKSLNITNTDDKNPLQFTIHFLESSCEFSLSSNFLIIDPSQTLSFEIYYNPTTVGTCSDILQINYGWTIWKQITVTGTGIEATTLSRNVGLLQSFDDYVEKKTIKGKGPGKSAENRLKTFRNMLKNAVDLIEAGKTQAACNKLDTAEKQLDSFITGNNISNLEDLIQQTIINLGCE